MGWMRRVRGSVVAAAILASACGGPDVDRSSDAEGVGGGGTATATQVNESPAAPPAETTEGETLLSEGALPSNSSTRSLVPPPPPPPTKEPEEPCVEDGDCDTRHCWEFREEQDISFVLVSLPCPALLESITVTDLNDSRRVIGPAKPGEPSNCEPNVFGYKFEGVNTRGVEVCVETSAPIDVDAVTIVVKAGQSCEIEVQGTGSCECATDSKCDYPKK